MKSKNPYRPLQYEERIHLICDRCLYAERMWSRRLSRAFRLAQHAISALVESGSRGLQRHQVQLAVGVPRQPRGEPQGEAPRSTRRSTASWEPYAHLSSLAMDPSGAGKRRRSSRKTSGRSEATMAQSSRTTASRTPAFKSTRHSEG